MSQDDFPEGDTATSLHAKPGDVEIEGVQTAHEQAPTKTLRPGVGLSSRTLAALRGVTDPVTFARTLQEWKHAVTDRGQLPRYRVIGKLGQGAQGLVFGVADRDCRREVALKTLNAHGRDKEDISRFIHEVQITSQLEHPGIVPIHDLDVLPDGTVFYTMKKVEGCTLSDYIGDAHAEGPVANGSKPTVHELLQIMLKICDTMAFAHSRHVIHRDLKPRNIMIGRYGEVLVMDWGLAKVLDGQPDPSEQVRQIQSLRSMSDEQDEQDIHQTMVGAAIGTPAYMSPEQAKAEPADRRSDLYSLGVILYRCLVGESPYEKGRIRYTLEQAVRGAWVRLDHRPNGHRLPKRLVAIVHTCMSLDPANRYQSADALAADLRSFLAGGAVSAYRETIGDRGLRLMNRQRRVLFFALGTLLVGGVIAVVFQHRQELEKQALISALRQSAVQHALMSEFDESRHDLERLTDLKPDDRDALDRLQGLRHAMARQADESLALRKRQDAAALVRSADTLLATGEVASMRLAMEAYLGALGLAPGDTEIAAAYRRSVRLISECEAAENHKRQSDDRTRRAAELNHQANLFQEKGDLNLAISSLESAILLEPSDERTQFHSRLIARKAQLDLAILVRQRQTEAAFWIDKVRSALKNNDGILAKEDFEKAQAIDSEHPELPGLREDIQELLHASAQKNAIFLLEQAIENVHAAHLLDAQLEEATLLQASGLHERRAAVLALALKNLLRAAQLAPWLREPRGQLAMFYLARLEEAEAQGDIHGIAQRLVEAQAHDDGTRASALAGLAMVQVATDDPVLVLRRVGSDDSLTVPSGAILSVPIGLWRLGDVSRCLQRGEFVRIDRPNEKLPLGCVYVPGGARLVGGEPANIPDFLILFTTVDQVEINLFRRSLGTGAIPSITEQSVYDFIHWKSKRDGVEWRLPTVTERRLSGFEYAVPELALTHDGKICTVRDATHFKRGIDPSAMLRLVVK